MGTISRADMEACGIPFADQPIFRDYVRQNAEQDISLVPPELRFQILWTMAREWKDEQKERAKRRQIEQSMDVAAADREFQEAQDRARHPERKALEQEPDPSEVGALPEQESDLPPTGHRRRRRRGGGARG